ncbi:Spc1p [Sugiyamaella lignohabitans]|uniref:Signal peptidase complex subunit 1 n=1 Tax=Sugiyamaella lignohabitans TaxID=796027 RepID=A0A167F3P4_9ASCO|nr:Spc1p [Sugiyamaella lignohabitans]ANB14788.1 Spc1p [Sugiyamaella lignohabitans]
MDQLNHLIEGTIDFEGQKTVEKVATVGLTIGAIVSFILGYLFQDILYTVYSFGGFFAVVLLATVPAFPFYNKNPVRYQEVVSKLPVNIQIGEVKN